MSWVWIIWTRNHSVKVELVITSSSHVEIIYLNKLNEFILKESSKSVLNK